ncbi:MAG: hypothetical protein ACI87O_000472, partial [Planctomycetota bacterium]
KCRSDMPPPIPAPVIQEPVKVVDKPVEFTFIGLQKGVPVLCAKAPQANVKARAGRVD